MNVSEQSVYAALRSVLDPELYVNVVDLGLIYEVTVEPVGDRWNVQVKMTLTSPGCPAGPQLVHEVREAILDLGQQVHNVDVKVVFDPLWTPDRMTDEARDELGFMF